MLPQVIQVLSNKKREETKARLDFEAPDWSRETVDKKRRKMDHAAFTGERNYDGTDPG